MSIDLQQDSPDTNIKINKYVTFSLNVSFKISKGECYHLTSYESHQILQVQKKNQKKKQTSNTLGIDNIAIMNLSFCNKSD